MNVRKYQPEDRVALIELWQRVFPDDPPHNAPAKLIDQKLAVDDLIVVVEQADTLIAACMAGYDGHRGWLYAVAVLPEHRRQGVGETLLNYTLDQLTERGCTKVNLQIRADNHAVADFYRSLGFEVEERLSMARFIGTSKVTQ